MGIQGRHCIVGAGVAVVVGALLGFVVTYLVMTHGNVLVDKSVHRTTTGRPSLIYF